MPAGPPEPSEFDPELNKYFGVTAGSQISKTSEPVGPEAVVAEIRSLMAREDRGYYLVKSYLLGEMKSTLFEACKLLASDGKRPELDTSLESTLRRNEGTAPTIRVITEDHIDFSRRANRETVSKIITGNAGLHLHGVYLVIGLSESTYRTLANSLLNRSGAGRDRSGIGSSMNGYLGSRKYYEAGIVIALIFVLVYSIYAYQFFLTGFVALGIAFIVLWFILPLLFFLAVRFITPRVRPYLIPVVSACFATILSGGIQVFTPIIYPGLGYGPAGGYFSYGYPFFYNYYEHLAVPGIGTSSSITVGFSWPGLLLDLVVWYCISIIVYVFSELIFEKYGTEIASVFSKFYRSERKP